MQLLTQNYNIFSYLCDHTGGAHWLREQLRAYGNEAAIFKVLALNNDSQEIYVRIYYEYSMCFDCTDKTVLFCTQKKTNSHDASVYLYFSIISSFTLCRCRVGWCRQNECIRPTWGQKKKHTTQVDTEQQQHKTSNGKQHLLHFRMNVSTIALHAHMLASGSNVW